MELTAATILITFARVFPICFMKGAFGSGFSIVGIPLLSRPAGRDRVQVIVGRRFRLSRLTKRGNSNDGFWQTVSI